MTLPGGVAHFPRRCRFAYIFSRRISMSQEDKFVDSSSFAPLGIIALESSRPIGKKVDDFIV